ncbi:hypothetical protein [Teichococcus aestuarii]|uniref:hypothetical protein n=1 Tax=Teichococcus aestuarii TaxID=568898 RepID=UPI0036106165
MVRPLTERTANMAKLAVPLPSGVVDAIQQLVEERNEQQGPGQQRLYARDLHEEALRELLSRVETGESLLFLAPLSAKARKSLWINGDLKAAVDDLAGRHGVTRAAVVMTALHGYLSRRGKLPASAAP